MKKRITSFILMLPLLLGLIPAVLLPAAAATSLPYDATIGDDAIYIGGVRMRDKTYLPVGGSMPVGEKPDGGYAYLKDNVLTLENFDLDKYEYDYIIGSVHSVCSGGKSYSVDESAETTLRAINEGFGGDAYAYCEAYYESVSRIYEKTKCDIIGRFDLVTKFIEESPIFSESHPRCCPLRVRTRKA